jgi:beta-glucosidase
MSSSRRQHEHERGFAETPAKSYPAANKGLLGKGVIDTALAHVLTTRMRTGEFDPRADVPWTQIGASEIQSSAHQTLARKVADHALVLLKNNGVSGTGTPLLPADPTKLDNVVIVGNLANTVTLGGYSGAPSYKVNAVQGITQEVKAANPNANIYYDSCNTATTATAPASCSAQTLSAIQNADMVVVFVGTDASVASEGHDRKTLATPGNYDSMIQQVAAVGNPRMLLAIQSNGPVQISDLQQHFPAVLFSGYNGESQGLALADVMFGQQNPSGHLDFTWYKNDTQLPPIENYHLTPAHTGGLGRTYMYFKRKPTYPFGYGLSYTTFKYSRLSVTPISSTPDGTVKASFKVTNTGDTSGATVAQLYVSPPAALGIETPSQQLEGFQLTNVLGPGQTQQITLSVPMRKLSRWDQKLLKQVVVDGAYQFKVGSSSAQTPASRTVEIQGTLTPRVSYVTVEPDRVIFQPGQTLNLTGRNPWIANDTQKGNEQRHQRADHIVEAVNNDQSFVDIATADVTYSSSNPNVATVTSSGELTAVSVGVATISAAIGGVTGSTPIVVEQQMSLTAPSIAAAGSTFTATTSLPNTSSTAITDASMSLSAPAGWTVEATSPSTFSSIDGGQTAQTSWQVTAPAGTNPNSYQLSARATFEGAAGAGDATAQAAVAIPYPALSAAYNNPAITDDAATTPGNFDGGGQSYSAQTLQSDGLTPGATVNHDGLAFTWPGAAPGTADNVVAGGQTIDVSGSGKTLGLLGSGAYGTATGTGTITYTDGTKQSFTLPFSDWYANSPQPSGDILYTFPYHNSQSGKASRAVSIYYQPIPLRPKKQVHYITLPNVSQGVATSQTAMHIFALSIG